MPKYTVVMDWVSPQDRDAVAFYVEADNPQHARDVAEKESWRTFGEDADYLYGVLVFEGHPPVAS